MPFQRRNAAIEFAASPCIAKLKQILLDVGIEHKYSSKYLSDDIYDGFMYPDGKAFTLINIYEWQVKKSNYF